MRGCAFDKLKVFYLLRGRWGRWGGAIVELREVAERMKGRPGCKIRTRVRFIVTDIVSDRNARFA